MHKARVPTAETPKSNRRKALTPEAREKQLIALAMDVAEERLRNGTASSQEVTHFLKLGSMREQKELEMLDQQKELMGAKVENLHAQQKSEELFVKAIKAFRGYSGQDEEDGEEYDD